MFNFEQVLEISKGQTSYFVRGVCLTITELRLHKFVYMQARNKWNDIKSLK